MNCVGRHHHRTLGSLTFPVEVVNAEGETETVIGVKSKRLANGDRLLKSQDGRTFFKRHPSLTYHEVADVAIDEDDEGGDGE